MKTDGDEAVTKKEERTKANGGGPSAKEEEEKGQVVTIKAPNFQVAKFKIIGTARERRVGA